MDRIGLGQCRCHIAKISPDATSVFLKQVQNQEKEKNTTAAVSCTDATSYGDKNMVKLLLQKGTNKDVCNKYSKTAYDLAAEHDHT
ncbi:hypothetical protein NL676_023074 [Syzygium grande]|nr:hypothetical protein NL676_023074 [Syzygium grande]